MIEKTETTVNVVFEGHYVTGHDPIVAQAAFAKRFGDSAADQVFNKDRAILKRNVTRQSAKRMQALLADVGVVVTLAPTADAATTPRRRNGGASSMVERAAERSRARRSSTSRNRATTPDISKQVTQPDSPDVSTTSGKAESPVKTAPLAKRSKMRTFVWIALASVLLVPLGFAAIYYGG